MAPRVPTPTAPPPTAHGPAGIPAGGALLQQHPPGILTDRDRGRPARQRHPSGHRQPGGNRGGIGPHRALGRLGPSGVAFGEIAGLQAPHHDQGDHHHHHASGHQPPVASCYVHADSRSHLRPVRQIVYLAPPSRPALRSEPRSLPGGMLAVIDVIPEEQPTPRWVALFQTTI